MPNYGFAMLIYLLAFQIACGVVGSAMGERKGMDGQGFAYGFFLGLFGLALVAVAPGNRRECPFCRELANPAATACPHCRRDIVPTHPAPVPEMEQEPAPQRMLLPRWSKAVILFVALAGALALYTAQLARG
jgi:hypothetical protein